MHCVNGGICAHLCTLIDVMAVVCLPIALQAEKTTRKAQLADRLVNGLSGENKRWNETIKKMEATGGKLVSCLCASWRASHNVTGGAAWTGSERYLVLHLSSAVGGNGFWQSATGDYQPCIVNTVWLPTRP